MGKCLPGWFVGQKLPQSAHITGEGAFYIGASFLDKGGSYVLCQVLCGRIIFWCSKHFVSLISLVSRSWKGRFETGRCAEGTVGWIRGLGRQIWALPPTRPLLLGRCIK